MTPFRTLARALGRAGLSFDTATLRDATRIALQAALASVLTYAALSAIGSDEMFVGILSAVMILTPSVGGTMQSVCTRLSATALGSVVGVACLAALPSPFATPVGLALTMFLLNGLAVLKPAWSYGVVAAVALSVAEGDLVEATVARLVAIALSAGIGLAVAATLWRDTAGNRFERHLAAAIRKLRTATKDVLDKGAGNDPGDEIEGWADIRASLRDAGEACDAMHMADVESRRRRLGYVHSLLDSIGLLDAVMERTGDLRPEGLSQPLKRFRETVDDVLAGLAGDDLTADTMPRLRSAFDALREALDGRTLPDPRGCDQAQVIAFAAGSIRDRLDDLVRALRDRPAPAPGWAARFSAVRARP